MTTPQQPVAARVRGHVTLDPAGIEMFAVLLHLLFAHTRNPAGVVGTSDHHRHAVDYVRAHARTAALERLDCDVASATYAITHRGRPAPVMVRILLGRAVADAVQVEVAGVWHGIDLSTVDVRG